MNTIMWIIISVFLGTVGYTLWSYLWKKLKDAAIGFDKSYIYSMLVALLLSILSIPFFLSNRAIPDNLLGFIAVSSGAFGFAANALFNTPLNYLMHQVKAFKATAAKVTTTVSTTARRIIEVLGVIVLIICILGASVYAAVSYTVTISATGSLTGVGVSIYSDAQGTINLNNINWGNIPPGGSITTAIYVKSTSNVPIQLYLSTAGWNPATLAPKMTLTWNYNNATINPGQIIRVDLTLAAATDAPPGTSFNFNIIITATG